MASVDDGGSRGKRASNFEVNLVPFIDLMSVLITFLLITAVWTQVSMIKLGSSLYSKQNTDDVDKPPPKAEVPLRVDVKDAGHRIIIGTKTIEVPKKNANEYDREQLVARLMEIKQVYPEKVDAVITVEEHLKYDFLIQGMDALLEAGFPAISVATGGAK
ncbi:MAG: biopolymer transporter ExbD [Bdellovibrionaceae bacterium]|nr:biopolymer transporter ExbD [Pseudobdellovibrionaceae bacterium]